MPDSIINKIKYLCKNIPRQEWSGLLFYEVKGSIRKPSSMVITIKDIFLMDRGTSTYTSFDWDSDIIEYRMNNPESLDWIVGHIHSHNTMEVFFSGIDWSELNDNCPLNNIYLSIIVNNFLDIKGKVAFAAIPKTFTCKDETGKDYKLELESSNTTPFMFVHKCEIWHKNEKILVPEKFDTRLKEIIIKSDIRDKEREIARQREIKINDVSATTVKNKVVQGNWGGGNTFDKYNDNKFREAPPYEDWNKRLQEIESEDDYDEKMEDFAAFVLNLGNDLRIDQDLVGILEDMTIKMLDKEEVNSLVSSILTSYPAYYSRFFDGEKESSKDFLNILEGVLGIYRDHESDYSILPPIIGALSEMGNKFEQMEKLNTDGKY